ncbi:MAG: hypothetical protein R3A48_14525 [Polyangiales bacterium]
MQRFTLLAALALGCGSSAPSPDDAAARADAAAVDAPPLPERAAGARAPRTAECDDADPARCLLPWPSDAFAEAAPGSATGLRLRVSTARTLNRDDVTVLSRADGFSRATPVLTSVPFEVDRGTLGDNLTAAVRLVVAEPGDDFGAAVPVRMNVVPDPEAEVPGSLLLAFPRRPLRAASEHVAALVDSVRSASGASPVADRRTLVALARQPPATDEERAAVAYFAPSRRALLAAGIDLARVARVWTFTTRSAAQPRAPLQTVREAMVRAVDAGRARLRLASVRPVDGGPVALIVEGFIEGLPDPMGSDDLLRFGADGAVALEGDGFRAPFRVMIPRGDGDWPVALWGHGTGGDVRDTSFDGLIASSGTAKVNIEFDGWTGDGVIATFAAFTRVLNGSGVSSSRLVRALGGAAAVTRALFGDASGRGALLGDALAAPTLGGQPNPAAGRRPRRAGMIYTGGSLGGTMGAVIARTEPLVQGAVLNVGGAAWTHFTPFANLFAVLRPSLRVNYGSETDLWVFLAMSQTLWDLADGATWADATEHRVPILIQQSMGDPVLPNPGTEFLAAAMGARHLGAPLSPVFGAETVSRVTEGAALTQYRVPSSLRDALAIHGFAAGDSPAGLAAQAQLRAFALSVQAGAPEATVPAACVENTPPGSCDFSAR